MQFKLLLGFWATFTNTRKTKISSYGYTNRGACISDDIHGTFINKIIIFVNLPFFTAHQVLKIKQPLYVLHLKSLPSRLVLNNLDKYH